MNNDKPSFASTKIDFKLVSKKLYMEAVLAAFISLILAVPICGLFIMLVLTTSGPPDIESPGEKFMIYGMLIVFILSFIPLWMLFTKILFRMTGRYEKLYGNQSNIVK